MPDTNQPFWEEFKAMMADPEQRKVLEENFERYKKKVDINKKVTIAMVGRMEDFYRQVNLLNDFFHLADSSGLITINLSMGFFEAGNLRIVRVCEEDDAYGKKFDGFINVGIPTKKTTEAAFYLVAHNTNRLMSDEFDALINSYLAPKTLSDAG